MAGLIMRIPGGNVFALLTIGYFAVLFNALEQCSIASSAWRSYMNL